MSDTCVWTEDEDGIWMGSCGLAWVFTCAGTPNENRVRYCMKCGKRVEAKPYIEPTDEEE